MNTLSVFVPIVIIEHDESKCNSNANILVTGTKHGTITLWPGPPPLL